MIATMSKLYDVAIIGLGAMGAAVAWRASTRDVSVVGLDQYHPPHTLGSTHGRSRIIREAYYEHPQYVPIVQEAYGLWAELESAGRVRLFQPCGGLMIGAPDSTLLSGARESAARHRLPVQEWSADELRARVPALTPDADMMALFEPRAGVLNPELGVAAMLAQAESHGATLRFDTPVREWHAGTDRVALLAGSEEIAARQLVIAAGGWIPSLVPNLGVPLTIERAVQYWFANAEDDRFTPAKLPIFLLETRDERWLYGLPDQGAGLKLAEHHHGEQATPETLRRDVSTQERAAFRALASPYVSGLAPMPSDASVCFYTNTPDEHFVIDRHPQHRAVYVVSACSGHGFKFAPAIGELVTDELLGRDVEQLSPFRVRRFNGRPS
jgi:sarcosine oxidase